MNPLACRGQVSIFAMTLNKDEVMRPLR